MNTFQREPRRNYDAETFFYPARNFWVQLGSFWLFCSFYCHWKVEISFDIQRNKFLQTRIHSCIAEYENMDSCESLTSDVKFGKKKKIGKISLDVV